MCDRFHIKFKICALKLYDLFPEGCVLQGYSKNKYFLTAPSM
jgi:hypothetical protein